MRHLGIAVIAAAFLSACGLALAADAPAAPAACEANGFVSIFNGKDLTGWDGDPKLWSVVDGAIRGQTTKENPAKGNTFLVWKGGQPKNFVLKIKWRYQNGNSGIQYRSKLLPAKAGTPNQWVMSGYQMEVRELGGKDHNRYKIGGTYMEKSAGGYLTAFGDFNLIENANGKPKRVAFGDVCDPGLMDAAKLYHLNDWNEYELVCMGNYVEEHVNGQIASAYIDNDKDTRLLEGLIGLQIHAGGPMIIDFKDISLKTLPQNFGEAVLLFNGKDLTGWTTSSDALKNTFSAKDGLIACTGKPAGYLRTEKQYTNYVLRLQLRHHVNCNAGVLVRVHGEDKVWPNSIECQGQKESMGDIWNIGQFPMKVDPARTKGRQTVKLHPSNEKPVGQWNNYDIYLNKGDLVIRVNGLVQNTATECQEIPGYIALQSEGGALDYRNIVLIPIVEDKK